MSADLYDVVGLSGSAVLVAGYAYSNLAKPVNFVTFNLLNLIGAVLLGVSLTVHFNLASFLLELVWAAIALAGLVRALRKGERA